MRLKRHTPTATAATAALAASITTIVRIARCAALPVAAAVLARAGMIIRLGVQEPLILLEHAIRTLSKRQRQLLHTVKSVSYTHLTLPTIYSV